MKYYKRILRNCLFVMLICANGLALAAPGRQELQEMRTLAVMATTNVLLYYNSNGTPYEVENREAFGQHLERLSTLTERAGDRLLVERVQQLINAVGELKNLPQSTAEMRSVWPAYGRWVPGLIDAYNNLEKSLAERYDAAPAVAHVQSGLHGLSQDIGQMLLSYQIASFPSCGGVLCLDQQLIALDAAIEQYFNDLADVDDSLSLVLKATQRNYQFVRQHLLDPSGHRAPSAVALYLTRTMLALDAEGQRMGGGPPR